MSRFTHARRWAAQAKRRKTAMTEMSVTADEARTAVSAMLVQTGHVVERIHEYDPRRDRVFAVARNAGGRLVDIFVPGETIARVVFTARLMSSRGFDGSSKPLIRPSELYRQCKRPTTMRTAT